MTSAVPIRPIGAPPSPQVRFNAAARPTAIEQASAWVTLQIAPPGAATELLGRPSKCVHAERGLTLPIPLTREAPDRRSVGVS